MLCCKRLRCRCGTASLRAGTGSGGSELAVSGTGKGRAQALRSSSQMRGSLMAAVRMLLSPQAARGPAPAQRSKRKALLPLSVRDRRGWYSVELADRVQLVNTPLRSECSRLADVSINSAALQAIFQSSKRRHNVT